MTTSIKQFGFTLTLLIFLFSSCRNSKNESLLSSKKPNVILIVADDLGYDFLGSYGDSLANTPNLDKLAQQGVQFFNYYADSPVCSPTRAALLTGLYPQLNGVETIIKKGVPGLNPNAYTLAEALKERNYNTGLIGKWHLGFESNEHPLTQGFDYFFGPLSGHIDYKSHRYNDGRHDLWQNNLQVRRKGHFTNILTDEAINYISNQTEPFFLYLPYLAPHFPYVLENDSPFINGKNNFSTDGNREDINKYRDLISLLDKNIGRIYKSLEDQQLLENTIIWFVSDNGEPIEIHKNYSPSMNGAKGLLLEGGIRVPSIIYWKDKVTPKKINYPVTGMDIMPTILDIVDSTFVKSKYNGQSIKSNLFDVGNKSLERILFWKNNDSYAVRDGNWKAIFIIPNSLNKNRYNEYFKDSLSRTNKDSLMNINGEYIFLYNLIEDPFEQNNLVTLYPDKANYLKKALEEWKRLLQENAN
jgi:arylsulfatase A-like enzyme